MLHIRSWPGPSASHVVILSQLSSRPGKMRQFIDRLNILRHQTGLRKQSFVLLANEHM